jgi:hypothetical protein
MVDVWYTSDGLAPTLEASTKYLFMFFTLDNDTTVYGMKAPGDGTA